MIEFSIEFERLIVVVPKVSQERFTCLFIGGSKLRNDISVEDNCDTKMKASSNNEKGHHKIKT